MKIGVFDSGSGGLTVLREMRTRMPNHEYVYFGDYARLPYGNKPRETIVRFSLEILNFLLSKKVEMIVVACNTIVASAMDELKASCPVPIIGVVGPTLKHVVESGCKNVGVAATDATVRSGIYGEGLASRGVNALSVACPVLVPLIESDSSGAEMDSAIEKYFSNFCGRGIDAVIMGCTHYPIVRNKIDKFLKSRGENIRLIDPAIHTADSIKEYLSDREASKPKKTTFWFGKTDDALIKRSSKIMGEPVKPKLFELNK